MGALMSWAARSSPIRVGDKVAYAKRFLRSIGCHTGDLPAARGTVTAVQHIGELLLADIDWGTPDLPGRVNVKNLSLIKNGMVFDHD